jgi:serine/threonine protein kinase
MEVNKRWLGREAWPAARQLATLINSPAGTIKILDRIFGAAVIIVPAHGSYLWHKTRSLRNPIPPGAGGMGEVYRARDVRLDRTVAVKVLASHLSSSPELKQRMEREARAISSLNHPHICHLYDIGSQDGTDYLVMEFLEGETLAERLRKGALPLSEILKIGIAEAEALAVAHRHGIVHRDLKPGNIMLTKGGAKLMDFGLAKSAAGGSGSAASSAPLLSAARTMTQASPVSPLTTAGTMIGTIQHMSPEQIEGKEADARSDLFALGGVLYEMVTAYASNESGRWEIYVTSFPEAHGKWQVSNTGGDQPRWRGDGKELFYLSTDSKIMAVPVKTGSNFDAGTPAALFQANPREMFATSELFSYDVSSDGQKFLVNTQLKTEMTPMSVILNWTAKLN